MALQHNVNQGYQPTAGFVSFYSQTEVNDPSVSLRVMCSQHVDLPCHF